MKLILELTGCSRGVDEDVTSIGPERNCGVVKVALVRGFGTRNRLVGCAKGIDGEIRCNY